MTPEEARTITRLGQIGCCVPCAGILFTALTEELPDTPWLGLVAERDPDAEVLKYLENPEEWE